MPSVSKAVSRGGGSPQTEQPTHYTCPYLHRTTGDTERKYHLRYYKTGTCIHETDARGHCVKNGIHCAFAHGPHDLRPPVYDIRELQAQETLQNGQLGCGEGIPDLQPGILASQAMIEKILSEDPRWQDTNFVLAGYKTEQCTKPPRLCRQGYACPHYHNSRDRRRNPRKFKYRSTPCPNVKHADEWGEPSRCESGDSCQYCHSRTEQQFHPEAKHRSFPAENPQKINEQDNKQNHLSVFSAVNPLASSITSSLASSVGSDSSSPTTVSAIGAKALPFYSGSNTVESVIGSALDLHFNDVNVASIDRELEDQEGSDLGLASQRLLGSSAPVNIPGSLVRSSSLHSSSSLSTSPLSSLSQSLSQSFVSSTTAPHHQQPQPLKTEHSMLGTSASSHNSLGLNGVTGSIWDFVTGSFSPSPSPVLSSGTTPSASSNTSGNELTRVRQELDDAKRKLKQWEESWQQVKQACDAWQKEAQEAKERANIADADKQLALQKKEEVENKLKKLKAQLAACLSTTLPYMKNYGDIEKISLPKLRSLQNRLHLDLETIDEVIFQLQSKKCIVCQEGDRNIILNPCQHYVLCDHCAAAQEECPCCKKKNNLW
ncbi:putative E3 ubiquitin-protein ligase UNKL isoform X8 [Larus michahellis]|uniref:putative E3 ubiquitin-protein ligase UNKL isoform X8 n=1 Tax=Larus michahellis TaxID=119627 RepID=UPI003D9B14C7